MLAEHASAPRTDRVISPFAMVAIRLAEQGFSPIPIMPNSKAPGAYSLGGWRPMREWTAYCDRPPTLDEVKAWEQWPDAGVGIALGNGVIAVDIDCDDLIEPISAALPAATVGKKGARGLTLFFRGDTSKIRSRGFKLVGRGGVDLLAHGKQTVVPPSFHPDTGAPYSDTALFKLADTHVDELPELPDDVENLIADALRPYGYEAPGVVERREISRHASAEPETPFRALNAEALANLDSWVPDLGLPRLKRHGGGWRAVAPWTVSGRGVSDNRRMPNLSFDPKGIKDFGDGDRPYTPIDVVIEAKGLDSNAAFRWLGEALGHSFEAAIDVVAGPSAPSERAKREAAETAEDALEEAVSFETPMTLEELARPPGLVGDIVDWIASTAERPSRAVALGPALGFVATLAGRQFASPTDARTNLYIATLAPSGYGKDRPREAIKRLAQAAALKSYLAGGRVMSTTALRNSLMRQPACLYMIDEFHGILRLILDKRNSFGQLLGNDLMELFTSAATFFAGAEYASTPAVDIQNPNLSIYGTSTQEAFWSSVSSASALDGFLARVLLFNVDGAKPAEVEPTASVRDVPAELVARCQAIASARGNLANMHDGSVGVDATIVPYRDGAAERVREFKRLIEGAEAKADGRQLPFLNRAAEHAIKLALTVAVGCDPAEPVITGEIMDWACRLSWHATCVMISEAQGRVADGQREADYNRLLGLIKDAGSQGMTPGILVDRTRNIEARRRAELLTDLQAAGRVRLSAMATKRGARERWTFVR